MAQLRDELQKKSEELANVQQVLRETEQEENNLREQVAEMKKELDLKVFKPIPGIMHAVLSSSDQIISHTLFHHNIYILFSCRMLLWKTPPAPMKLLSRCSKN